MGILEGKTAVITGGSRGLGLAIAEAYAREGARVVLAARGQAALDAALERLRAAGYTVSGFACDAGDLEQVRALAQHTLATYGALDIWVNNAGIAGPYGPTADVPVELYERVVRTNILGTYYGSVVALDQFLAQGHGKLINLLGRGDDRPVKFQNAYAPSKAWVMSFTKALAQEYQGSGVGIFAFNPGLVDTELLRQLEAVEGYEKKLNPLRTVIRLWANPPNVPAERALWLASPATDGRTGLVVNVLGLPQIIAGLLRDLGRRIRRTAPPDTTLEIRSIPSRRAR